MDDLEFYFTEKNIVELLCKYRANEANKRHSKHMIRNVSLHEATNKVLVTDDQKNFKFLQRLNAENHLFEEIIPLSHPRFVMQYRLKRKDEYIRQYLDAFEKAN